MYVIWGESAFCQLLDFGGGILDEFSGDVGEIVSARVAVKRGYRERSDGDAQFIPQIGVVLDRAEKIDELDDGGDVGVDLVDLDGDLARDSLELHIRF